MAKLGVLEKEDLAEGVDESGGDRKVDILLSSSSGVRLVVWKKGHVEVVARA